ncbi:MAG: FHA domain-containing protein [Xanthomonadaceae bacterium]|nr:FHA domain-containing protein [Xanthomonadaceae bacterium]MDE1959305.1 FHA domain-containing protein [Xanthomonadaceae bacterium]MDE2179043.1 FHA domain-containing protein [Xanthomonadaceae bacterium]MDE2245543.1 FHA domain-containing protein [Xanthomonadaceae bacterium]
MRLGFPAPRDDFASSATTITIGRDAGCDLRLEDTGISGCHLRLSHDRRGTVLDVLSGAPRVYVNARPVRERALLTAGDQISVGSAQLLLKSDQPPPAAPLANADVRSPPGTAILRMLTGALSGQTLAIAPILNLDGPDLPAGSVWVELCDGVPCLRSRAAHAQSWLRVNGHAVTTARLHDGDQIVLGMQRFRVEAPTVAARDQAAQSFLPHEAALPEDTAGPRREVWWLLLTAAALALAIALVLAAR